MTGLGSRDHEKPKSCKGRDYFRGSESSFSSVGFNPAKKYRRIRASIESFTGVHCEGRPVLRHLRVVLSVIDRLEPRSAV